MAWPSSCVFWSPSSSPPPSAIARSPSNTPKHSSPEINHHHTDAETGGHVWAERFGTDRQKLAEAEDEIIGRLARTLNLELVEAVGCRIEREKPANPDARDLVM